MQKYGLKVTSPFEIPGLKVLENMNRMQLTEPGNFELNCDQDINIEQVVTEGVNHLNLNINGDNLSVSLRVKSILQNDQIADVYHNINLNGFNIKLNITGNLALQDSSKVIYRSLINSNSDTTGEGNQRVKFLILSQDCEVDAEPSIDSTGEEFKTSHGISIGGLNPKVLNYLNLHGLNNKECESIILESEIFN